MPPRQAQGNFPRVIQVGEHSRRDPEESSGIEGLIWYNRGAMGR